MQGIKKKQFKFLKYIKTFQKLQDVKSKIVNFLSIFSVSREINRLSSDLKKFVV